MPSTLTGVADNEIDPSAGNRCSVISTLSTSIFALECGLTFISFRPTSSPSRELKLASTLTGFSVAFVIVITDVNSAFVIYSGATNLNLPIGFAVPDAQRLKHSRTDMGDSMTENKRKNPCFSVDT